MTSPYDLFKEKQIDETTPAILDYGSFQIHIKHGGASNKPFVNAAQFKLKQFERRDQLQEKGSLSDDALKELEADKQRVLVDMYAEHVIVDWKDVTDKEGNELKFNKENVVKLLTDLPILFQDIIQQAMDVSNFKEVEEKESEKN